MGRIKARLWATVAKMEPDFVDSCWDEAGFQMWRRAECRMTGLGESPVEEERFSQGVCRT